ncbi:hypothetical protein D3C72_1926770 [compost metagenome]
MVNVAKRKMNLVSLLAMENKAKKLKIQVNPKMAKRMDSKVKVKTKMEKMTAPLKLVNSLAQLKKSRPKPSVKRVLKT